MHLGSFPAGYGREPSAGHPDNPAEAPASDDPGTDRTAETDAALTVRLRAGDVGALTELYERHFPAAVAHAAAVAGPGHRAEDLAGEAFARTIAAVRAGAGPKRSWPPYLLAVIRNTAHAWAAADRRSPPTADADLRVGDAELARSPEQLLVESTERELVVAAFRSLPDRWRVVLWYAVVERRPAVEVAALLGLSVSGVHSLAVRAREGLREAYLAAHLPRPRSPDCRACADRLAALVRRPPRRIPRALAQHLDGCAACRRCLAELREVNRRLLLTGSTLLGPAPGSGSSGPPPVPSRHRPLRQPSGAGPP
ncbi:RNA polymerase sigma factor [Kitasatospora sp. NPDC059327]|uniref:RNA polymerase sigma factor n=1 Tax=Kitasatospora sp. NPDC059327 TaxID=3346803 RepID=UPI00369ABE1B